MNFKSVLLGTAAATMMASGAFAADAVVTEAAPAAADYVKICDAQGSGFFYIPGSETCLNINGRVRVTSYYYSDKANSGDSFRFRTDYRFGFKTLTATEIGKLETTIRYADGGIDLAYIKFGNDLTFLTGINDSIYDDTVLDGINSGGDDLNDGKVIQLGYSVAGVDLAAEANFGGYTQSTSVDSIDTQGVGFSFAAATKLGGIGLNLFTAYSADYQGTDADVIAIKPVVTAELTPELSIRAFGAYYITDSGLDDGGYYGAALSYGLSKEATLYAGIKQGVNVEATDDVLTLANVGVDYTLAKGLVATGEVDYYNPAASDDYFVLAGRLTRSW